MWYSDEAVSDRGRGVTRMKPNLEKLPDGQQLLDLYRHQYEMFDRSLAIERDITVKNFAALGAVLLAQSGFLLSSLKVQVVLVVSGVVLIAISIAARAMSIIYSKYSDRLYILADITLTVYLRGRDGLKIYDRRYEAWRASEDGKEQPNTTIATDASSATKPLKEKKLRDADDLSWRELFRYLGALSLINLIPGGVGLLMILCAIGTSILDPNSSWQPTRSEPTKTATSSSESK